MTVSEARGKEQSRFLVFRVGGHMHATPLVPGTKVLRVPPGCSEGFKRLPFEGQEIEIADLAGLLGVVSGRLERLIVIRCEDRAVGFLVQSVETLRVFDPEQISAPPSFLRGKTELDGMVQTEDGPIVIINLIRLAQKEFPLRASAV